MELTSIASSSEGNSIFVGSKETKLLVDCGISAKRIEKSLDELDTRASELSGILITHEHSDHIKGLGVMLRRYGLPVFATAKTIDAVLDSRYIGKVDKDLFHPIEADHPFQLDDITVEASHVWHDAADPVCYSFYSEGFKASIATDLGDYDEYLVEKIRDSHILFVEANHDVNMLQVGPYPYPLKQRILGSRGHLSNENSGRLLCRILHDGLKHISLGHLSQDNNLPELAYETVRMEISLGENPYRAEDFQIQVARRSELSPVMVI